MDDAGRVRRGERVGDLRREIDRLLERQSALDEEGGHRPSFDQLHHHVRPLLMAADVVHGDDAGVIER